MGDARGNTPPEDGCVETAAALFAAPGAKIGDDAAPMMGGAAAPAATPPRSSPVFLDAYSSSIFKHDDIVDRRFGDAIEGSTLVAARADAFASSIVFRVSTVGDALKP